MKSELKNIILTSYFCTLPDPISKSAREYNYKEINSNYWMNKHTNILPLINSVKKNNCKIIIFYDDLEETFSNDHCEFIKVNVNNEYTPTISRWFHYKDYLINNEYENIFMTDSTDVLMLKNPFEYVRNNILYCGSEYRVNFSYKYKYIKEKINNIKILDFKNILKNYDNHILLNCGIVGGQYNICLEFLNLLTLYHEQTSKNIKQSLDIPIFNYTLLKHFKYRIKYGQEVHTKFTDNEFNEISWWKHR